MLLVALKTVYAHCSYTVFSLVFASVFITIALLWPNTALLLSLWQTEMSVSAVLVMVGKLLLGAPESIGALAVSILSLNALLLSIVLAQGMYIWRHKRLPPHFFGSFSATSGGVLSALLGIGCVACGPLLVGGLFATIGAGGLLLMLPLHGAEFGFMAILLLAYAIYSLAKVITAPLVCDS